MGSMPSATIYQDAKHYDWLAGFTAPNDLPFYQSCAARFSGPILELGCGTGRVSLALAKQGYQLTGIDLSEALLAAAGAKAREAEVELRLHHGDMRAFDLSELFALALCPYNAFNHLLRFEDVEHFLGQVARHLQGGGKLVIDTIQPDPAFLGANRSLKVLEYRDPSSGKTGILHEENCYDSARQVNRITWSYVVAGETVRRDELQMRMFFPQELDALLSLCGWKIEEKLGDYSGVAFGPKTPKQLIICSPPGD
jgi:SAM-dependent methyltransferase